MQEDLDQLNCPGFAVFRFKATQGRTRRAARSAVDSGFPTLWPLWISHGPQIGRLLTGSRPESCSAKHCGLHEHTPALPGESMPRCAATTNETDHLQQVSHMHLQRPQHHLLCLSPQTAPPHKRDASMPRILAHERRTSPLFWLFHSGLSPHRQALDLVSGTISPGKALWPPSSQLVQAPSMD